MSDWIPGFAGISQGARNLWDMFSQGVTWRREDNAVQRRVHDLEAAGLNRTLAAGSAASSSAPIMIGRNTGAADAYQNAALHKAQVAQTAAGTAAAIGSARKVNAEAQFLEDTMADRRQMQEIEARIAWATEGSKIREAVGAGWSAQYKMRVDEIERDLANQYRGREKELQMLRAAVETQAMQMFHVDSERARAASARVAAESAEYNLRWSREKKLPDRNPGMWSTGWAMADNMKEAYSAVGGRIWNGLSNLFGGKR